MSRHPLPDAGLKGHIAVVGMTGGGKTFTTKGIVEHILERDPAARVCVLDPIKSDWWGVTSSADGKKPGLPFHILGGPRGHVPLHETAGKAIGELVGSGALPLSIIDMADFGPGGLQTFFNDFAPALLRRIRGVVYLVLEEAHEFAPKERAGFGGETMTVHFAKKLATAGRSKGVRIIAATQRTQQLHNSVLGSCQTVIAHQLTYPADIEPVAKWFKGHVDKETFARFSETLTSLPTGTGWLCSGQAKVAEMVQFPRIWTFDNSATPDGEDEIDVKTAPVDLARLRAIVGDAVAEAEANDPATLKAEIARLKGELTKKPAAPQPSGISEAEHAAEVEHSHCVGIVNGLAEASDIVVKGLEDIERIVGRMRNEIRDKAKVADALQQERKSQALRARPTPGITHAREPFTPATGGTGERFYRELQPAPRPSVEGVNGPMQRILDACAWWEAVGVNRPSKVQVAVVANYSPNGGAFNNPLGRLRSMGFVEPASDGTVALMALGRAAANNPESAPTTADLHQRVMAILNGPQQRILAPLLLAYPRPMTKTGLATEAGYSPDGGAFNNPLGSLRSLGFIDYPSRGQVVALPILFVGR